MRVEGAGEEPVEGAGKEPVEEEEEEEEQMEEEKEKEQGICALNCFTQQLSHVKHEKRNSYFQCSCRKAVGGVHFFLLDIISLFTDLCSTRVLGNADWGQWLSACACNCARNKQNQSVVAILKRCCDRCQFPLCGNCETTESSNEGGKIVCRTCCEAFKPGLEILFLL